MAATLEIDPGSLSRRWRRFRSAVGVDRARQPDLRVWAFNVALGGLTLALIVGPVSHVHALVVPYRMPIWALAGVFFVAEICIVGFQFGRNAYSFSLSEMALVLGLFLADPFTLLLAQFLGAGAALALHRRQPPRKLVFNLVENALEASLAVLVFHAVSGSSGATSYRVWAATVLATLITSVVAVPLVALVISAAEGRLMLERPFQVLALGLAGGALNTSLALVWVTVLLIHAPAAALLVVPGVGLFGAYRAYMSERRKHEGIGLLYQSSRSLQQSGELDDMLVDLLAQARHMFKADIAALVLLTDGERSEAFRSSLGPDSAPQLMVPMSDMEWRTLHRAATAGRRSPVLIKRFDGMTVPGLDMGGGELRDCLLSPLRGEEGVIGVLMVANRLGDIASFDRADRELFAALAGHASIAVEKGRLQQRFRHLAFHDALTNLANRVLFLERLEQALKRTDSLKPGPAILFVDLDDFKNINDSLGHAAGDRLLVAVSERLRACLRPQDTVARLGGDEFGILIDDLILDDGAIPLAERVLSALLVPFSLLSEEVRVNASIGVVVCKGSSDLPENLVRDADVAMYIAKSRGKSRYALFDAGMTAGVMERRELKADLQRAVARGEFSVRYQPWVSLKTEEIVGTEALVRWEHPERGLIGPDLFIPLAEESGLIVPIGRFVLEEACRTTRKWQLTAPGRGLFTVSVNISLRQLHQPRFVEEVMKVLEETGLAPADLVLEITETVMMHDSRVTIEQLARLRKLGVSLAVDDFGTGYSSLSRLGHLPINILKIARPFVDGLGDGGDKDAFVSAIVSLGSTLRLRMVAEGIESAEQVAILRRLGCQLGQGYLFAKPLSETDMRELLISSSPRSRARSNLLHTGSVAS